MKNYEKNHHIKSLNRIIIKKLKNLKPFSEKLREESRAGSIDRKLIDQMEFWTLDIF